MIFSIFLIFLSLVSLIVLHELGHFIFAKIFKVKVEEFGIFLPPSILKKKVGQTIVSINLLPVGAFVKLYGEREIKKEKGSFSNLPILKRILIVLGGALSFWVVASILTSIILSLGTPVAISDEENFPQAFVQIVQVFPDSPASLSKLMPGDEILEISGQKINKVNQLQKITKENLGKEISLKIKRGEKIFKVLLTPRVSPPEGQGPIGISIVRVGIKKYPIFEAILKAPFLVFQITFEILKSYFFAIKNAILRKPTGITFAGPIGVSYLLWQASKAGIVYFLNLLSLLSIYLAIFNLLPIPALDGGKILFLLIEGVRRKPISKEIEEKITTFFFAILLLIFLLVTISDIKRFF
jgi:regulator of sigma E protease